MPNMDSTDIQEQSTLVILPLRNDHDQIESADLEEKNDKPVAIPTTIKIRVTECDDQFLEGDTLVEDLTPAPISDAKSTFNGKGT